MNIYEIDEALTALVDPETGEILDYDAFAELQMSREVKIDNMAWWVKDLNAEEAALDAEIKALTERRDSTRRKRDRLKTYLHEILQGEKRQTSRYVISYRKSESVEYTDEAAVCQWLTDHGHPEAVKEKISVTASKTDVKNLIKQGEVIPGAEIIEKQSMNIK